MNNRLREKAIRDIAALPPPPVAGAPVPVADILASYAADVFTPDRLLDALTAPAAAKLLATLRDGAPLDPDVADEAAAAMRAWALERGATHYTHWFQPLTGGTAEKHDALFEPDASRRLSVKFSGRQLISSEPDASSFPSGGLRSTFEARGYTAWDPTSPAFVRRVGSTVTLCIPTAFCSYTGEALDLKTPLLRSIQALHRAVARLMEAFGAARPDARPAVSLGPEQEYFLVDRRFYLARPDLVQTGRTLFGAPPPKHQQLEDHYFGSISPRVLDFMADVERQLWRLGIPAKTRHNEVAPAQFELAPLFEDLNLAADHNLLTMEVLRQTAERHGLVCLLHEKPFAGVNGSGKHNNWSLSYGGVNLLDPGSDPRQNAIFLAVLLAVVRAVDLHADLLRAATASAGNDHRLGANEAPPAVLSVFLGDQLSDVLAQLEAGDVRPGAPTPPLSIGVDALPPLPRDATDRNRTSPFAFTGNKFEFRAPGSSQSCATPMTVLNTIVADSLSDLADAIAAFPPGADFNASLQALLRGILVRHKRILFNGNGYDPAWLEEAARRGLPNLRTVPEAVERLVAPENIALFERHGVFSAAELRSRREVRLAEYDRKIRIEARLAHRMAVTVILPVAVRQLREFDALSPSALPETFAALRDPIARRLEEAAAAARALDALLDSPSTPPATLAAAMAPLRTAVDALERLLADDRWPLPKYREMLFVH
ncbi:MAG: glutamine synthetase III [Kiritimatiellae bacterium]|nr:glutamine synthetase III [Kiritimatiellia bacterium]